MTGVSVSDTGRIVTTRDVREALSSQLAEIEEFVEKNKNEGVLECREVEMFEGVFVVMDWSVEGLRDSYILVDTEEVEDWYESPDGPDVTKNKTEVVTVSKEVAWGMETFRDDARVLHTLESGECRVEIDYSGRTAPRFVTKLLDCVSGLGEFPSMLEYSERNSSERMDAWG